MSLIKTEKGYIFIGGEKVCKLLSVQDYFTVSSFLSILEQVTDYLLFDEELNNDYDKKVLSVEESNANKRELTIIDAIIKDLDRPKGDFKNLKQNIFLGLNLIRKYNTFEVIADEDYRTSKEIANYYLR